MLTYFITANNSISCVAFKTNAAHSSRRSGRMNSTCCLWYTWRNCWTWINTFVSATRLVTDLKRCTIHINSTILFLYYWFRSYFVKRRKGLRTMFFNILLSSLYAYVVYNHQYKDLLCNLVCRYNSLCDCVRSSLHWQHSHRDLHTFHFGKLESLDNRGLSSIHKACILYKDCLYVLLGIGILLCEHLLYKTPLYHTVQKDMDPDILFGCMLGC